MSRRKVGVRKEIKVDFANFSYLLDGIAGIGKTTMAYEIGRKLYGEDGFLLLTIGQEPLPEHLGGILNDRANDWAELEQIVDELVEYRDTDYKNLKLIGIDTVDELFRLGEEEAVSIYNASVIPEKRVKSISQAFGGFQKGENKVVDLAITTIFKLRNAGYGIFFIGHTKVKNKKDLMTDIEFEQLTSNLDAKYYNAIKDKVNIVACAYIEREMNDLETVKDAFNKKDKQVGRISSERRVVVFRDEEYAIDVKSHFIDIEPKIDFGADEFINAILTAIKKQKERYNFEVDTSSKDNIIEDEIKEESKKETEDKIETINSDIIDEAKNKELIKSITTKYKTSTPEQKIKVKEILSSYGTSKFDIALPTKAFENILSLFE